MLSAVPYHLAIRDLVKALEPRVWDWFGQRRNDPQAAESLRFELLKSTYRLSRDSHAKLYAAVDRAAQVLEISLPITLYQSQTESLPNASLAFAADELHIVLTGNVDASLNDLELQALMGHELGHHVLNQLDEGDHWRTWDILRAACLDAHSHPAFMHSFRKFCLYSEIFCDRAALAVVTESNVVISMLVKVTMGAASVDAVEFLQQAQEVLDRLELDKKLGSEMSTHPETYIRAHAIDRFSKQEPALSDLLARLVEGTIDLGSLDLMQQQLVSRATRQLLRRIFHAPAMRTDLMLSHARLYFEDFAWLELENSMLSKELSSLNDNQRSQDSMSTYFAYVLLDFATADRNLDEFPLANSLQVAEELGIKAAFTSIAKKELKLRKKQIEQCDRSKNEIIRLANSTASHS